MTWGIVGIVGALVAVGLLLWRERGKRAAAERKAEVLDRVNRDKSTRLLDLAAVAGSKEKRIKELERDLAEQDPGALFDDTFGKRLRGDSEGGGKPD